MAVTTSYKSPNTVTTTGGWAADSGTLVTCVASSDDVRATHAAAAVDGDYLVCLNYGFNLPGNAIVTGIDLFTEDITASLLKAGEVPMTGAYYTFDGTTNQGTEKTWLTTQSSLPGADGTQTVSWSGLSLRASQVNATTFGVRIHRGTDTTPPDIGAESGRAIDRVQLRVTYTLDSGGGNEFQFTPRSGVQVMDMRSLEASGYEVCQKEDGTAWEEAMPSVTSSAYIFENCPDDCRMIQLTIRTAGITLRYEGTATTTNGHDFSNDVGYPYIFYGTPDQLRKIQAIATSGTPTGWISYMKKKGG